MDYMVVYDRFDRYISNKLSVGTQLPEKGYAPGVIFTAPPLLSRTLRMSLLAWWKAEWASDATSPPRQKILEHSLRPPSSGL